jgi:acyl-CoA thioesterase
MSDLEHDTRVEGEADVYHANVSPAWEIWGPNGGYLGVIALRAAGKVARIPRPVSFDCHFVRPARLSELKLDVVALHLGRQAESIRVSASQEGKLQAQLSAQNVLDQAKSLATSWQEQLDVAKTDPTKDPSYRLLRDQLALQLLGARTTAQQGLFLAASALGYEVNMSLSGLTGAVLGTESGT